MKPFCSSILARRINSPQQLHEVASTTEALFERQDAGDLFCLAAQRRHPRNELRGFCLSGSSAGIQALLRVKALPSSVIDLHPQSPDIDFIAAKT
jgi:hypothetical protein